MAQVPEFSSPQLLLGHLADVYNYAVVDVNQDGLPDLVGAVNNFYAEPGLQGLRTLLQQDDGRLLTGPVVGGNLGQINDLIAADFDGDGVLDLVAGQTSNSGGGSFLFMGLPGGGYLEPELLAMLPGYPFRYLARDMDGDEDLDLLVFNSRLMMLENLGDGEFSTPDTLSTSVVYDMCEGDFDGDGDTDLAIRTIGTVGLLRNDGAGVWVEAGSLLLTSGRKICAVDADGDGDLDLVTDVSGDALVIWNSGGEFPFADTTALGGLSGTPKALMVCDVDGNGTQEILFADASANRFGYWPVDPLAEPHVGPAETLFLMESADGLKLADLDGDGRLDLLLTSTVHGRLDVRRGLVTGFVAAENRTAGACISGSGLILGDLDLDGDVDAVAATYSAFT
ncbi:MAG: VCBS repeat-containing protein [Candidatus Cloacimonetes bacterium]|nr:VCBS repeat-containing protein [Candidatus Cloacimonadota bacterium]